MTPQTDQHVGAYHIEVHKTHGGYRATVDEMPDISVIKESILDAMIYIGSVIEGTLRQSEWESVRGEA